MRLPGRARKATRPARTNAVPVTSCSHSRVVTNRPYRNAPSGSGNRGGRDGLVAVRVDREVLLEVSELEEPADRAVRRDDEQLLASALELVGRADDDAEGRGVDERGAAHVEHDDGLGARGPHGQDRGELRGCGDIELARGRHEMGVFERVVLDVEVHFAQPTQGNVTMLKATPPTAA